MENNNKLIAEFMGFQYTSIGWYDAEESLDLKGDNTFDELKFDTDWNWLMPVVKKCREESNDEDSYWEAIYYSLVDLDIDNVYIAVVEFIKWYNENK
jgi:hypothetical protein